MKRNTVNFVIDAASGLLMLGVLMTGLLLHFVLPHGSGGRRWVWGLSRHDWGEVHLWIALGGVALVLVHLLLHWQWVCVTTLRFVPGRDAPPPGTVKRVAAAAGVLIAAAALVFGTLWAAEASVTESLTSSGPAAGLPQTRLPQASAGLRGSNHVAGSQTIRGSTTLAEAARAAGVSVETARARLGLSADTDAEITLGRLIGEKGLSMHDARRRLSDE